MSKLQDPIATDPRPTPPVEPELEDCCGNGCDPCVFDLHQMAKERYRAALSAWEARQATSTEHIAGTSTDSPPDMHLTKPAEK